MHMLYFNTCIRGLVCRWKPRTRPPRVGIRRLKFAILVSQIDVSPFELSSYRPSGSDGRFCWSCWRWQVPEVRSQAHHSTSRHHRRFYRLLYPAPYHRIWNYIEYAYVVDIMNVYTNENAEKKQTKKCYFIFEALTSLLKVGTLGECSRVYSNLSSSIINIIYEMPWYVYEWTCLD